MSAHPLRRPLNPLVRVLDEKAGLVEYVASDETLDSYREVIRADGWRFTNFAKNAPFVDSHDYSSVTSLLGKVVDFEVRDRRLIERVQWAIDVPENQMAQIGWRMTAAGYLKAVSVGFYPTRSVSRWDNDRSGWTQQLADLGLVDESGVRTIFIEQEQVELSSVIIGANPNALARAYKSETISAEDLDFLSRRMTHREPAPGADIPERAPEANALARVALVLGIASKL
jgi:hypothetical protein